MTAASIATSNSRKLMKMVLSLLRRSFNASKCKTAAKMAVARIKLLRNKREVVVKQMRRDIALLLRSGQDATARIRIEHVLREQNILAANEIIELFCELIVSRLSIIAKQRECPLDLKEGIASLIFAAPRCSDIPELLAIRDVFEKKYGKDFVSAATDLRPDFGVNRLLIDKLSVKTPSGEVKLKIMKEIAKEHQIEWDTTESEKELLKPAEELEGPRTFVSAASLPVKSAVHTPAESNSDTTRPSKGKERGTMHFYDAASAAEVAAESAKQAIAAAEAAAALTDKNTTQFGQPCGFDEKRRVSSISHGLGAPPCGASGIFMPNVNAYWDSGPKCKFSEGIHENQNSERFHRVNDDDLTRAVHLDGAKVDRRHSHSPDSGATFDSEWDGRVYGRHSHRVHSSHSDVKFDESDCDDEKMVQSSTNGGKAYKRHGYNSSAHSDIKFDESDCEEYYTEMEDSPRSSLPPGRPPPPVPDKQSSLPRVHPKLPDYDELAARLEALKYHK